MLLNLSLYVQLWTENGGKFFKDKEVMSYISAEGIKWKYTIAFAPWQGGFYERLVGLVKRCMRKSIGRKRFFWSN